MYDAVGEGSYEVEKDDELGEDVDSDTRRDEGEHLFTIDSQGYHLCSSSSTDDDLYGDGELGTYKEKQNERKRRRRKIRPCTDHALVIFKDN